MRHWMKTWAGEYGLSNLESALEDAEQLGIKLERVGGMTVWEASPVVRHQSNSFRIQSSIRATASVTVHKGETGDCGCFHYADLSIRFPDGSYKRPDLSVFCEEPQEKETSVTSMPEAVIEIISKDYEAKDLELGVPFYLQIGVPDVVVFDPYTGLVRHFRPGQPETRAQSPVRVVFACGCECTV